ncbi:hypothetical protein BC830DRAFT_1116443, partial [Chytriomyces sp. MP71]
MKRATRRERPPTTRGQCKPQYLLAVLLTAFLAPLSLLAVLAWDDSDEATGHYLTRLAPMDQLPEHVPTSGTHECDVYSFRNGHLSNESGVWTPNWSDPCNKTATIDDHVMLLRDARLNGRLPLHLANKTVLLVGDSFDRNLVQTLCEFSDIPIMHALLNGSFVVEPNMGSIRICAFRAGPDVFTAINIFHFGVMGSFRSRPKEKIHWEKGYSPLRVEERISWLPHFMRSVARHAFPELCPAEMSLCPNPTFRMETLTDANLADSAPPLFSAEPGDRVFWFPFPSVVVAQSAMWDLARLRDDNVRLARHRMAATLPAWRDCVQHAMWEPLVAVFGSNARIAVRNATGLEQPQTRFYTRTVPVPGEGAVFASTRYAAPVDALNDVVRAAREEPFLYVREPQGVDDVGLLDWDRLASGRPELSIHNAADPTHPNRVGNLAFWQLLLSRL